MVAFQKILQGRLENGRSGAAKPNAFERIRQVPRTAGQIRNPIVEKRLYLLGTRCIAEPGGGAWQNGAKRNTSGPGQS